MKNIINKNQKFHQEQKNNIYPCKEQNLIDENLKFILMKTKIKWWKSKIS